LAGLVLIQSIAILMEMAFGKAVKEPPVARRLEAQFQITESENGVNSIFLAVLL